MTTDAPSLTKLPTIGLGITSGTFDAQVEEMLRLGAARRSAYVCCVNAHMTAEARDPSFRKVVLEADLATPDGMPVLLAMKWLNGVRQERVAGNDLMPALLQKASERGLGVYLYGGSNEVQAKIMSLARTRYPGIRFAGAYAPPFGPLESLDLEKEAARINATGANLIMVSLGCPKQERFMHAMKGRVNGVMLGLGGAFLLFAGVDARAPAWMRRFALEWLYRLWLEPRRLWRRYLVTNSIFIVLFFQSGLRRLFGASSKAGSV